MPRVPSSVYFESLAKVFGMQLPHLWTGCYPRSYEINSAYAPPFYASVDLALLQGLMSRGSDYILEQQLGEEVIAAQKVARSSVPTYFICPELFTVARKPQNQLKFDWTRMRLTHEAASFVFPREGLSEPDGDAFKFAWYARVPRQEEAIPSTGEPFRFDEAYFVLRSIVIVNEQEQKVASLLLTADHDQPSSEQRSAETRDALTNVVFNTLLLMTIYPEVIQVGHSTGKTTPIGQEVWTPSIVGKGFTQSELERMFHSIDTIPTCEPGILDPKPLNVPGSPEWSDCVAELSKAFRLKFGRDMQPGDPLFFDPAAEKPQPMSEAAFAEINRELIDAFLMAGVRKNVVYAFKKTGFMPGPEGWKRMSPVERQEWADAVNEYELLTAAGTPPALP